MISIKFYFIISKSFNDHVKETRKGACQQIHHICNFTVKAAYQEGTNCHKEKAPKVVKHRFRNRCRRFPEHQFFLSKDVRCAITKSIINKARSLRNSK